MFINVNAINWYIVTSLYFPLLALLHSTNFNMMMRRMQWSYSRVISSLLAACVGVVSDQLTRTSFHFFVTDRCINALVSVFPFFTFEDVIATMSLKVADCIPTRFYASSDVVFWCSVPELLRVVLPTFWFGIVVGCGYRVTLFLWIQCCELMCGICWTFPKFHEVSWCLTNSLLYSCQSWYVRFVRLFVYRGG